MVVKLKDFDKQIIKRFAMFFIINIIYFINIFKTMSKNNRSNDKESDRSKHKQGKLDPKKPFGKITTYDPESSNESSDNESIQPVATSSRSHSFVPISSVGSTARNQFISCLKNRSCLNGVDFIGVMAKKQGATGTLNLKGSDLKRALAWKEQMLVISNMCHTGSNFL